MVSRTAGQDLLASPFPRPNVAVLLGAHGLREEPEFVTARAGESVVLRCDVVHPVTGQPPPYVVEWFKFGVPIPIFIKFGYYPPHVDPEYAGKGCPIALASCLATGGPPPCPSCVCLVTSRPFRWASYLCFPVAASVLPSFALW